ncbi:helix-turn-helix domain-containing protein [Salibacterium halotolerans]|uniref:Helix-turn-helix domain-containing protein n=1 Tax=Salibacterium halotolerans TaxID=1884432 RepID=A0A1I5V951_9BACI|nr:helix-turn-helix domain-containing protein [Salibacterium halotolerans]SFQ03942.1 Helix-turn-helix domain-containing protein [Salibacterium halotolerans]
MTITLTLIQEARNHDEKAIQHIIDQFEPFMEQCLTQTQPQEREDLRQDLRLSCIESIHSFESMNPPGFFTFCRGFDTRN